LYMVQPVAKILSGWKTVLDDVSIRYLFDGYQGYSIQLFE
jgi:hypothetical protein